MLIFNLNLYKNIKLDCLMMLRSLEIIKFIQNNH
jgi:hypothetical protein